MYIYIVFLVYKITNIINGKLYFGITKCTIQKRWNEHKHNSIRKKKKSFLNNAIYKYGYENFKIELVKSCETESEMYDLEISLIKQYKSNNRDFGYNNSIGGEKSSKGKTISPETKAKLSVYQSQRIRTPFSEETKIKMRKAAEGRSMTLAIIASANSRRGKPSHNCVKIKSSDGKIFNSITEAYKQTGVSATAINNNLKNKSKTAGGLKWSYMQEV